MPENVKRLSLRLNEAEYAHLKQLSAVSGLKLEPLIRSLIMGAELKPRPPEEWAAILRQLSGIGTNINQIAKIANAYGRIRQEDVEYIIQMQSRLWRMIKAL